MSEKLSVKERHAHSFSKRLTITYMLIECMLIVCLVSLYRFDHDETNLGLLNEFIENEFEYCYEDDMLQISFKNSTSISSTLQMFRDNRFELETSVDERFIETMEEAKELYELLLPDNIRDANNYIRPWIYTWAIHDVRTFINQDTPSYDRIQWNMLSELRLHEVYLHNNIIGLIYREMSTLVMCIVGLQVIVTIIVACVTARHMLIFMHTSSRRNVES